MKKSKSINTRIFLSIAALVLILALAVGTTFSWTEGGDKGYVNGNDITISTGSNLTMRQDDKLTSSIIIPACTLEETSSADGRNFFFPLGGNKEDDTMEMTFREGVPSDVNKRYVSVDFELEAGDKSVDVYLGAGTIVQCNNKELLNALRFAFYYNDGTTPLIFKPNQMPGVDMHYSPISKIDAISGDPTIVSTPVTTEGFGSYYYKGDDKSTPLFQLDKNECKHISLAVWLEGTEFDTADIAGENLDIYIDFTTTVDDLVKYTFIDNCHNRDSGEKNTWVSNNMEIDLNGDKINDVEYETMVYLYDNTARRYYALESQGKNSHTWVGYVPKTINNFFFRRYSIDIDEWWNEWEPSMQGIPTIVNSTTNTLERTFIAIAGQELSKGTNLDGCYGYWKDADGTFRIYFEMQAPFSNLHCYAWDTSGKPCASTGAWPGKGMKFVKNISSGVLYYIDLKESENVDGIQFNNGGETRVYLEGFGYSTTTSAYVYYTDHKNTEQKPLGVWHDNKGLAKYESDNTVGKYHVKFTAPNDDQDLTFNIIANNQNNLQYPASGAAEGKIGRVYRFNNNSTSLTKLAGPYDIKDDTFDNYIFNGAAFWYKSDNNNGFYVYTGKEESMIYPVNDPTQ